MEISFYEVASGTLIPSLVRILAKVHEANQRCLFVTPNEERLKAVDKALWTFSTNAFVPHGDKNLGFKDLQPIYFSTEFENPNQAVVLVMTDFDMNTDFEKYNMQKVLLFFDDNIEKAEHLANTLKNEQKNVNYWKQSSKGWIKIL